jgi:hypothetical protein
MMKILFLLTIGLFIQNELKSQVLETKGNFLYVELVKTEIDDDNKSLLDFLVFIDDTVLGDKPEVILDKIICNKNYLFKFINNFKPIYLPLSYSFDICDSSSLQNEFCQQQKLKRITDYYNFITSFHKYLWGLDPNYHTTYIYKESIYSLSIRIINFNQIVYKSII